MTRFLGHHVSREMLVLWLLEVSLLSLLIYTLLSPGPTAGPPMGMAASGGFWAVNRALVLSLTIGAIASAIGLYQPDLFLKTRRLLINTALAGVLAFPAAWLVSRALGFEVDSVLGHDPLWPLKLCAAWILLLFATRLVFRVAMRLNLFVRRVLVLGEADQAAATVEAVRAYRKGFFKVAGVVPAGAPAAPLPPPEALRRDGIRDLVLVGDRTVRVPERQRGAYEAAGVRLHAEPEFWERHLRRINVDEVGAGWLGPAGARRGPAGQGAVDRAVDVVLSLGLLVLTLPLMLLTALVVRLDSPGPVLYRQVRVGQHGRPFTLLKFRSMKVDAEARGPAWAAQSDPRVTRVGSFMRRTRIDELPQLLNVLRGEMSFIGPRPERPHFVEQLAEIIPHYRERALVKPGLTGWAQVNFPYGASVEDARMKLSYDLYYVKHRSLLLNLLILFATVRVILFQEGAR